jgi:hypothetical protein
MSDGTIHSIAPFMLQGSTSTPHSLTPVVLDLMLRLWMDSSHVFRGWCQICKNVQRFLKKWKYIGWPVEHLALTWLFRTGRPKCQVSFILFQISMSLLTLFQLSNFNVFSYVSLICCRCLVDKLWLKSTQFTKTCHLGA